MAGQPIPELRDDEPVLGLSARALGQLQQPDPSLDIGSPGVALPVDDIPPIGSPGAIQPKNVSALSVLSPTSAAPVEPTQVADPAVPEQPIAPAVAPVEPLEQVFEPEAASPRAELDAGVAPSFVEAQTAVATLSAQEDALNIRGDEIQTQLGLEKDPAKRLDLEKKMADNMAARAATGSQLDAARGVRARNQAVETVRIGDAIAQRKRNSEIELEQDLLDMDAQRLVDDEEFARAGDEARARVAETKERTAVIIERGPQADFADTALAMVSEAIKPLATPGGQANYDHVVSRLMAQNEAQHGREIEAAKLRVEIAGDEIGNIGRRRKEEQLQNSVRREMTIRQLRVNVEREAATTTDEFTAARALTIVDNLKQAEEAEIAKQQVLQAAQAKRDMIDRQKFRKGEADIALTGAKIGTERQKAIKAAAEAAKAARAGRGKRAKVDTSSLFGEQIGKAVDAGQLDEKGAKLVFQQGVIDPVTGNLTTRANGSFVLATSPKVAAELNESGARVANVNNLINEAISLRGAEGWEPTSSWFASDAGKRMAALSNELLLVNKDIFKLGVLSDGDIDLMKKIQGGDLAGLQDPRPVLRARRDKMIAKFNQRRKSLAPGSQKIGFDRPSAPKTRTLQQTRSAVRDAFDPDTGSILSKETRFANVEEGLALLERERKSKTEAFKQTAAEIISYIGDESRGIEGKAQEDRFAIGDARARAINEGKGEDHPDIVKLDKTFDEQVAFEKLLRQRLPRFIKGVTEQEDLRERAKRGVERLGVGSTETAIERTRQLGTAIERAK